MKTAQTTSAPVATTSAKDAGVDTEWKKYVDMLNSITDAFFAIDKDWKFVYLNSEAERQLQRSKNELLGKSLWEEFPLATGTQFDEQYHKAMRTGMAVTFEEYYPALKTWFAVHAYPSKNGLSVFFTSVNDRRAAEQKAKKNEENLVMALKASSMGMWEWDIAKDELLWSDELKKLFGLQPNDIITYERYLQMLYPEDRPRLQQTIKDAMRTGGSYKTEHRIVWPDGSIHWVLGQGQAFIKNSKPVRMLGTAMNIDARKAAEEELQHSQNLLHARILQQTAVSQLGLKALASGNSLKSLMNDAVTSLKEVLDVEYTKVLELLPDGKNVILRAGVGWHDNVIVDESTVDTGKSSQAGYTLLSNRPVIVKDLRTEKRFSGPSLLRDHGVVSGMSCIIYSSDGPYGVLGIHTTKQREFTEDDVSFLQSVANVIALAVERQQVEIALRESEERFRSMADSAPVLTWMSGTDKLCFYFNKPWLDFTGRTLEQEQGDGWLQGVHPDDMEYCMNTYTSAFDACEPFSMEYRLRRHDEKYRWLLDTGTPRYSPDGEFLGYIGSCTDIEDIKNTKKRQDQLEEVNLKLQTQRAQLVALHQSKDEFISLASHQLRTPATGVKQYIGMLIEGYIGNVPPEQMQILRTAYESNERQLTIIDDLLKVAQIDAGKATIKKTNYDLVRLLTAVIEEQSDKFKARNQQVTFNHSMSHINAMIDCDKIRMVLENLVDNASKYTPSGKKITVTLSRKKDTVVISIKDQGVGIADKDLPRLFQKFSRVNNTLSTEVGGTGLGLYWANRIMLLHNGTIDVHSKLDKGSEFVVSFSKN